MALTKLGVGSNMPYHDPWAYFPEEVIDKLKDELIKCAGRGIWLFIKSLNQLLVWAVVRKVFILLF